MHRLLVVLTLALTAGCSEQLLIRSVPPGAQVSLNGTPVGTTPMVYQTRDPVPLAYRIEAPGLPAAEGTVSVRPAPGRIVGTVFTLGILAACRPLKYFTPNPLDVQLDHLPAPVPPSAVLRLYNVKGATVLEGECLRESGTCTVRLPNGEECVGDYVRDNQGTTTVSTTSNNTGGYGVAFVPGAGVGSVGFRARNEVVAGGKQISNVTEGVAVLRCRASIIDCKLTLDANGMQGHGECTDTHGAAYRATLLPGPRTN